MLGPIDTVRLFTKDLDKALAFYRDMLEMEPAIADEAMAIFVTGSVKLMVELIDEEDAAAEDLVGRLTGVSFAVEDIRGAVAALSAKNVSFEGRPEVQPWGGALAHFFDADGNVLTLVQYPRPD